MSFVRDAAAHVKLELSNHMATALLVPRLQELFTEHFNFNGSATTTAAGISDFTDYILDWPVKAAQAFFKPHNNRADRFALVTFLLVNGASTYHIRLWYEAMRSLRDVHAKMDVIRLIKNYFQQEPAPHTAYELATKQWVKVRATVDETMVLNSEYNQLCMAWVGRVI